MTKITNRLGIVFNVETFGEVVELTAISHLDGEECMKEFPLTLQQLEHGWDMMKSGCLIQDAFPRLSSDHRAFLINPMSDEMMKALVKPHPEDEKP